MLAPAVSCAVHGLSKLYQILTHTRRQVWYYSFLQGRLAQG